MVVHGLENKSAVARKLTIVPNKGQYADETSHTYMEARVVPYCTEMTACKCERFINCIHAIFGKPLPSTFIQEYTTSCMGTKVLL